MPRGLPLKLQKSRFPYHRQADTRPKTRLRGVHGLRRSTSVSPFADDDENRLLANFHSWSLSGPGMSPFRTQGDERITPSYSSKGGRFGNEEHAYGSLTWREACGYFRYLSTGISSAGKTKYSVVGASQLLPPRNPPTNSQTDTIL